MGPHVIDDNTGTPVNKVSVSNILNNLPDYLGFADSGEAPSFSSNVFNCWKMGHYLTRFKWYRHPYIANGSTGQIKYFVLVSDGGSSPRVTPSGTFTGGSYVALDGTFGDSVQMLYTGSTYGWVVIGGNSFTVHKDRMWCILNDRLTDQP